MQRDWDYPVPFIITTKVIIMNSSETLNIIKDSFESWYNKNISKENPVSIAINYSDVQTLRIKAYHTVTMEVAVIEVNNGKASTSTIISLTENYNHGVTSEIEAKEGMTKKLLMAMYSYNN